MTEVKVTSKPLSGPLFITNLTKTSNLVKGCSQTTVKLGKGCLRDERRQVSWGRDRTVAGLGRSCLSPRVGPGASLLASWHVAQEPGPLLTGEGRSPLKPRGGFWPPLDPTQANYLINPDSWARAVASPAVAVGRGSAWGEGERIHSLGRRAAAQGVVGAHPAPTVADPVAPCPDDVARRAVGGDTDHHPFCFLNVEWFKYLHSRLTGNASPSFPQKAAVLGPGHWTCCGRCVGSTSTWTPTSARGSTPWATRSPRWRGRRTSTTSRTWTPWT